jgi:hypothetical protein
MGARRRTSPLLPEVALLTLVAGVAAAQSDAGSQPSEGAVGILDLISLDSSDPGLRETIDEAIAMWRGCPQFGIGFPRIATVAEVSTSSLPDSARLWRQITVTIGRDRSGRGLRCATFQGSSIVLHRSTVDRRGRIHPCGALVPNLAHEIGHALGVGHDSPVEGGRGTEEVMRSTIAQTFPRRRVTPFDCSAVDRRWMTSLELARARALALAPPEFTFGKSIDEVAAAWHQRALPDGG